MEQGPTGGERKHSKQHASNERLVHLEKRSGDLQGNVLERGRDLRGHAADVLEHLRKRRCTVIS